MNYRTATIDDIPAILALWRYAEAEPSVTDDRDALARCLAHDPESIIVAEEDGVIIGSVIAGWDGWRGGLYRLAVAHRYRRRGIGSELMRLGEEHLVRRGARRLHNIVLRSNNPSLRLHEALGWQVDQRVHRLVKNRNC